MTTPTPRAASTSAPRGTWTPTSAPTSGASSRTSRTSTFVGWSYRSRHGSASAGPECSRRLRSHRPAVWTPGCRSQHQLLRRPDHNYITAHPQITPATFPMFETSDTYLTQGGCCMGAIARLTASRAKGSSPASPILVTFAGLLRPGHEVGEWMMDPLTNGGNSRPCGIMENGDPLEGGPTTARPTTPCTASVQPAGPDISPVLRWSG